MQPSAAQPDPPVARLIEQVLSDHAANVGQDLRRASRMQPMAAVVHALPRKIEAAGVAADAGVPLEDGNVEDAPPRELQCGSQARGPGAKDDNGTPGGKRAQGARFWVLGAGFSGSLCEVRGFSVRGSGFAVRGSGFSVRGSGDAL